MVSAKMASAGCELNANGASSAFLHSYDPLTSSLGAAGLCALTGLPLPHPGSAYDPKVCAQVFVEALVTFAEQYAVSLASLVGAWFGAC
jgi:hypothetical protein